MEKMEISCDMDCDRMDKKLKELLKEIDNGKVASACVFTLMNAYYQRVIYRIDEIDDDDWIVDQPFPEELKKPVADRISGIGQALFRLCGMGFDVNEPKGSFNALRLAVGCGDAPMVKHLIAAGADSNFWPDPDESCDTFNYLDVIDTCFMYESFANDCNNDYLDALFQTALVLAEDGRLGPYKGHCLKIDQDGNVSLGPAKMMF